KPNAHWFSLSALLKCAEGVCAFGAHLEMAKCANSPGAFAGVFKRSSDTVDKPLRVGLVVLQLPAPLQLLLPRGVIDRPCLHLVAPRLVGLVLCGLVAGDYPIKQR